jgi:hypothetical protein
LLVTYLQFDGADAPLAVVTVPFMQAVHVDAAVAATAVEYLPT